MVIDFHSHIIPAIDDGSQDMDMTINMLNEECDQGIDTVIVTPHFYAHRKSIQDFLDKRERRLADMREVISRVTEDATGKTADETDKIQNATDKIHGAADEQANGNGNGHFPVIIAGAEVYYFQGMGKAERLPDLCIGDTDVILVEMPFAQWTDEIYKDIKTIITNRQLKVVLAHIERYPEFQKNSKYWDMIMDLPLTTQINAGSFLKGWRRRKFCIDWIKGRPASVLGSDAHNLTSRAPNIAAAREVIKRKAGADVLENMDLAAAALIAGH